MVAEEKRDRDDINVMMMTAGISVLVIVFSVLVLWLVTSNVYLGADYIIETFFGAPNVYADATLSGVAASGGLGLLAVITFIVILDNLSKILIISFILAAVFDIISYKSIDTFINRFRAKGLNKHVIICGYNNISDMLGGKLASNGIPFVFIEDNSDKVSEMNEKGMHFIMADYKSTYGLKLAGVDRAIVMVLTSQNDLDDILGAIAARKLNKKIKIISRVGNEEAIAKMHSIGVDVCMIAERLVGKEIGEDLVKVVKS